MREKLKGQLFLGNVVPCSAVKFKLAVLSRAFIILVIKLNIM